MSLASKCHLIYKNRMQGYNLQDVGPRKNHLSYFIPYTNDKNVSITVYLTELLTNSSWTMIFKSFLSTRGSLQGRNFQVSLNLILLDPLSEVCSFFRIRN